MPSNDMQELLDAKTGHVSGQQAAFFKQWDELISHEEREMVRFKKEIWTMTADQRQATGRCVFPFNYPQYEPDREIDAWAI